MTFLNPVDPMGIYKTLYAFHAATGHVMGTHGTHPWSQGFPLTSQLPDGPPLPKTITITEDDRKYPKAWGNEELRDAIASYYNTIYGSRFTRDNVCVFGGGRPALAAVLSFMDDGIHTLIEETEYTPYWDVLQLLERPYTVVPSNPDNLFRPGLEDYQALAAAHERSFIIKSNPCNPTGRALTSSELSILVAHASTSTTGALFDEAYEFFVTGETESAARYVQDINDTNIFITGAVTKGLQSPGTRVGWVIAAEDHIRTFGNFSSFAMGGVSRPSQLDALALLEPSRVAQARAAVRSFYSMQRDRYGKALADAGMEMFTGDGGFYHWCRLPGGASAEAFNERLFEHDAAILPGTLCDMLRRGEDSPLADCFRFSFGAVEADSFDEDVRILQAAMGVAVS